MAPEFLEHSAVFSSWRLVAESNDLKERVPVLLGPASSLNHPAESLKEKKDTPLTDDHFYQGCLFSPDGLCVLTHTTADSKLRIYNVISSPPSASPSNHEEGGITHEDDTAILNSTDSISKNWKTDLVVQGGDTVRSYAWFPRMDSRTPLTCCFAATCREQPIHLFDAYTGAIRATYCPFNDNDEMDSPRAICFSTDGSRILSGGFRNSSRSIHIFDVGVPGRDSTVLHLGKTRRSSDGQKGLVSSLACTSDEKYFAVGTYSPGSIYIYDDRAGQFAAGSILQGLAVVGHGNNFANKKRVFNDISEDSCDGWLSNAKDRWFQKKAQGGVTQLQFDSETRYYLYSCSRRSNCVILWDLRMLSSDGGRHPVCGILGYTTDSETNQRIQFDVDHSSLYVGGRDKCVRIYDKATGKANGIIDNLGDVANGVSCFSSGRNSRLLAVATGSRSFNVNDYGDDSSDSSESNPLSTEQGVGTTASLRLFECSV